MLYKSVPSSSVRGNNEFPNLSIFELKRTTKLVMDTICITRSDVYVSEGLAVSRVIAD